MVRPDKGIELCYLRQDSHVPTTYYALGEQFTNFKLSSNFVLLNGTQYLQKPGSKVDGFLGWMIGANFLSASNPDNGYGGNATKFAWGIRGGGDIWITPTVAFKIQLQLLSTVQGAGGGLYFGTGGAGVGVSTYSSMLQFGIGGGLVFKLGGKH